MRKKSLAALEAHASANGYQKGAHREQDAKRNQNIHGRSATRNQEVILNKYLEWHCIYTNRDRREDGLEPLDEVAMRELVLGNGVPVPSLCTIKDFIRFCVSISRGQIVDQMTVESTNTYMEWFFAGFTRHTGTSTDKDDRKEIYEWVRKVLAAEGEVVKIRRDKNLLGLPDLVRLLRTLWTKNDLSFIHERYRIQFTFIFRMYCWTGARLSAFFTGPGLRYGDIELVLLRNDQGEPKLIYKVQQRWIKNNRHPDTVHFDSVGRAHAKFIFDDASFLFALAIADGALYDFKTIEDLREQQIPPGDNYLILPYKQEAREWPILRKCDRFRSVTAEPMAKSKFLDIYKDLLQNAGYECGTSIHAIRRALGKKVDEIYSEVQRSQHLTQTDPRVFGQSYTANCSSVDGQAAYLGESTDHQHVEFFQSLERLCTDGRPCKLSEELKDQLEQDEGLTRLNAEMRALKIDCASEDMVRETSNRRKQYRKKLQKEMLERYRAQWTRDMRERKIRDRGKERFNDDPRNDIVACLFRLIPQRKRPAEAICSDEPLSPDAMWNATRDLHALCTLDQTVVYLPEHWPVDGNCPVESCSQRLQRLSLHQRNSHIHYCMRQQVAKKMHLTKSEIHYCYRCYEWCSDESWEEHCQSHVPEAARSMKCGEVIYCHTAIRPWSCPFCLGGERLQARERLIYWRTERGFQKHLEQTHLQSAQWPMCCPHPSCKTELEDDAKLRLHFADAHGIRRNLVDRAGGRSIGRGVANRIEAQDSCCGDSNTTRPVTFFTPKELTWTEVATSSLLSPKTGPDSASPAAKEPLPGGTAKHPPDRKTVFKVRYTSFRPGEKRKFERVS